MTTPPEITSGVIYAGPGPGSLLDAAQAWQGLATELQQIATSYRNVINGLTDVWQGSSATVMVEAVQPFLTWMESTATVAWQSAQNAISAAGAYEEALAAVVPPPVIASNRAQLMMLVSTNLLGQNSALIAANEAHYEAMWAQDTTAMTQYSASSSAVTAQLVPFQSAPQVATPVSAVQAAATPAQTTLLGFLQQLFPGLVAGDPLGNLADILLSPLGIAFVSSGELAVDPLGLLGSFLGLVSLGTAATAVGAADEAKNAANAAIATPRAPSVSVNTPPVPEVKAATGTGNRVWNMRVPPSWTQPQQQGSVAEPLPHTTPAGGKENVPIGLPVIPAVPVTGVGKAGKKKGTQFEDMDYGEPVAPILKRHPSGG